MDSIFGCNPLELLIKVITSQLIVVPDTAKPNVISVVLGYPSGYV